jgi:hypothetical protein
MDISFFSLTDRYTSTFSCHFEELKILNTKHQIELLFNIHHENYYQTTFVLFGHACLYLRLTLTIFSSKNTCEFHKKLINKPHLNANILHHYLNQFDYHLNIQLLLRHHLNYDRNMQKILSNIKSFIKEKKII